MYIHTYMFIYVCIDTESQRYWQSSSQRRLYINGLSGAVVARMSGSVRHLACGNTVTSHLFAVGAEFQDL